MPESSSGEINLAVEKSDVEQVEDEAKIQLTLLFISKVGEVLVDILETTRLVLREGLSMLLLMLGKGLLMSEGMAELVVIFGVVVRMAELGSVVLGEEARVYILSVETLEANTDSGSV